jgi:DNA polymerase delta subunit 1
VDDDDAERALILNYARFVRSTRPDMITGWNIDRFDGNYLCLRARYLGIAEELNFSRMIGETSRIRNLTFQNNAAGKTEFKILTASGVVDFDAFNVAKKDVYLSVRKYDLNTVSWKLLKLRKYNMPYALISPTYYGGPGGRGKVHAYCAQDCRLVWKDIVAAGWHYSYITQARAAGVPLQYMCFRGVQIRILAKQLQVMHPLGMIVPYIRDDVNRAFFRGKYSKNMSNRKHGFVWDDRDESVSKKRKSSKKNRTKGYSGATVIDPVRGWHEDPVGILDFASLYPNEMREKNLCFSTVILDPDQRKRLRQGYDYRVTESGAAFVLEHVRKGIIPIILDELLTLRAAAKKTQRRYTKGKDVEWDVYEGRQMGLKLFANSVYGSLGTLQGTLANFDVAEAVTSSGRRDLLKTSDIIKAIFARRESFGYEREYVRDADGKYVLDEKYRRIRKLVDDGKGGTTWPFVLDEHGDKILKISCDALVVIYGDTGDLFFPRDKCIPVRNFRPLRLCVCQARRRERQARRLSHRQKRRADLQCLL